MKTKKPLKNKYKPSEWDESKSVEVIPEKAMQSELSIQEAAKLLNVSETFIKKMIDGGKLSSKGEGGKRLLSRAEVLEFKTKSTKQRKRAADRLTALNQKLGLE